MQKTADGYTVPDLPENPTPEDRAIYVILRLEQFIREGRTFAEGMPFKKWQALALTEIATSIADAENEMIREDPITNRLLFTGAASLITIGFWGTVVSIHQADYLIGALVCGFAGLVLLATAFEWPMRKFWRKSRAKVRKRRLKNIESLNRKIRRLERELEKEAKDLEKTLEETLKTESEAG